MPKKNLTPAKPEGHLSRLGEEPFHKPKGATQCRNYSVFSNTSGVYVIDTEIVDSN